MSDKEIGNESIFGGEAAEDREEQRKRLAETRKNSLAEIQALLEKAKVKKAKEKVKVKEEK